MAEYVAPGRGISFRETPVAYLNRSSGRYAGYTGLRDTHLSFEHTELFTRNLGETTDVVSKGRCAPETRGADLTLRPRALRSPFELCAAQPYELPSISYITSAGCLAREAAGGAIESTRSLSRGYWLAARRSMRSDLPAARFFTESGVRQFDLKLTHRLPRAGLTTGGRWSSSPGKGREVVPVVRDSPRAEPRMLDCSLAQGASQRRPEDGLSVRGVRGSLAKAGLSDGVRHRVRARSDARAGFDY